MIRFRLSDEECGVRLDKIVQQRLGISRKQARQILVAGGVRVGGKIVRVLAKEFRKPVEIEVDEKSAKPAPSTQPREPEILHREPGLLVVNKPSGILSEGGAHAGPSVEAWARREVSPKARLVHRLDAPTSGVMLVALGAVMAAKLGDAFREGLIEKSYLALVQGRMKRQEINGPIGRQKGTLHAVMKGGKAAATSVHPLIQSKALSFVEARPKTGRTHQIRVHCSHVGHPLVGDGKYGGPRVLTIEERHEAVGRCMLHAWRISLPESLGLARHAFDAPLPPDFVATLDASGLAWRGRLPERSAPD